MNSSPAFGLTPRQADLLAFIERFVWVAGVSPSFSQMCTGIGVASKSNIGRLLNGLEERGAISRLRGRHRAIALLRKPTQ